LRLHRDDRDEPAENATALPTLGGKTFALHRERAREAREHMSVVPLELGRIERPRQIGVERGFVQVAGHLKTSVSVSLNDARGPCEDDERSL
jgi:hypothetical protein